MQERQKRLSMKSCRFPASVVRAILFGLVVLTLCAVAVKASPAEPLDPTIYDVPLSDELQAYIANLCEEHHIEPEIVIGLIEKESTFNPDAVGDNGNSLGLMQIQPKWHKERMERLGCDDLLDPFQNVTVGVDILSELIDGYGDTERALMVYNAGATGAYNKWFQYGVYSNEYSSGVLANATKLTPKEDVEEVVEYIPDNYDIWVAHEEKKEKWLETLPLCARCGDPIQQEMAVYVELFAAWLCDDCLDMCRREVVTE